VSSAQTHLEIVMRAWLGLVLLAPSSAFADGSGGWDSEHRVTLGVRAAAWHDHYDAPGIGGQIQYRPAPRLALEGFWNSFALPQGVRVLHDHIIGFHVSAPMIMRQGWFLAPEAGLCVGAQARTDLSRSTPSVADMRFGPHAGALFEGAIGERVTLGARATAYAYVGNDAGVDGWATTTSNQLVVSPTLQGTVMLGLRL
jgi:hypothetical protein